MRLLKKLWRDEAGLVVSAETMMVGTLGVIGAVAGIATATSSVNEEMSQLGQAFRGFNQSFSVSGTSISSGRSGMTAGTAGGVSGGFAVTTGASGFQQVAPSVDIQAARTQYLQTVAVTTQALELQSDVCGQTSAQPQHLGTIDEVVVVPRSQTLPADRY
jgi:hypothetical protein